MKAGSCRVANGLMKVYVNRFVHVSTRLTSSFICSIVHVSLLCICYHNQILVFFVHLLVHLISLLFRMMNSCSQSFIAMKVEICKLLFIIFFSCNKLLFRLLSITTFRLLSITMFRPADGDHHDEAASQRRTVATRSRRRAKRHGAV